MPRRVRSSSSRSRPVEYIERIDAGRLLSRLGDVVHQGVAAELMPLAPWREEQLLDAVAASREPLLLALDGVQDPHNLGACLRTADACGVIALIVPRDRAAPLNATARKAASGAAETTPVVAVTNLARTLGLLKDAGLWIVGADADGPQTRRRGRSDRSARPDHGRRGPGVACS